MSDRAAPSELWQTARWLLQTLFTFLGEPQDIAIRGAVDRKTFLWFTTWLRACETMLRRLLLIEARALHVPPASSRHSQPAGKTPAVRARQAFSLNPDAWRVSLRLLDRQRLAGGVRCTIAAGEAPAVQEPPSQFHPAIPLAHRAEALLRAYNDPMPYARRLARLIARVPRFIARILAPPHAPKRKSGDPPHIVDIIGRETWAALNAALPSPNSS